MVNNPILVAVPASVLLWAVGLSAGGASGSATLTERADGRDAERLIVEALLDSFDEGLELVSVTEHRDVRAGGARTVDLGLAALAQRRCCGVDSSCESRSEQTRTVRVVLDSGGRVARVEVSRTRKVDAWQVYRGKQDLLPSLRAGQVVHSLELEPSADGGARLVGRMRGGRRFLVYLGDFTPVEPPCAC